MMKTEGVRGDTKEVVYCPTCRYLGDRTTWGKYVVKVDTEFHVSLTLLVCPHCKTVKSE